jgi:pantothenate kinase-related protein Tda10
VRSRRVLGSGDTAPITNAVPDSSHSEHLKPVNAALHEYEQFYRELDGLVVIKIGDVDWVYKYVSLTLPLIARISI